MKTRYIIGLDEVGRGALAGPVVVAGVALPAVFRPKLPLSEKPLKDSKKTRPKEREIWFRYLKTRPAVYYALARVYPKAIDRLNISEAANRAAGNAFEKLLKHSELLPKKVSTYLDGGLFIRSRAISEKLGAKTLIRGDEKINAVKLASIVAKVNRDKYMVRLAKDYPVYAFREHKGYGTKKHLRAIKKHGASRVHRLTFLNK